MRVLMLTRQVDREATFFAFTHGWVAALARRVERLEVICQSAGAVDLPDNVSLHSLGKDAGISKGAQLRALQRLLGQLLRHTDVIFSHMIPRYALLAAPGALRFRVPMVQWYTLGHTNLELRLAHAIVRRVVTASRESFPLPSRKVTPIGHGIDFTRFTPAEGPAAARQVLAVGSLTPWKGIETLIDAAALLTARPGFEDVTFTWLGGELPAPLTPPGYRAAIEARIAERGLAGRFRLAGPVSYPDLPDLYRGAAALAHLSGTGSIDKAPLEALGCGIPLVATDAVYRDVLGDEAGRLMARPADAADVASRLGDLLALAPEERRALALRLRERAVEQHGLEGMMDRLVRVLAEAAA
ncbi:MAG: hypothetical protein Kow00124_24530 [Anaerolineae bacterium]